MLKVMTIVGTRPEIIRLSRIIAVLDQFVDHKLVHTGQNYDYELNDVFFDDLDIRRPDYFLEVDTSSLGKTLVKFSSRQKLSFWKKSQMQCLYSVIQIVQ